MLIWSLRALVFALALGAFSWLVAFWRESAALALLGFFVILLLHGGLLLSQFAAMVVVNRSSMTAAPSPRDLAISWLREVADATRVFFWWQPFRAHAYEDLLPQAGESGARGVVLLHGFMCNRGVWTRWMSILSERRIPFVAVELQPPFGSIDGYASSVEAAVRQITAATGRKPLLVCHSMGGLVARAWLRTFEADDRVHRVVTIGSPHQGTLLGHLMPALPRLGNTFQMRQRSGWLAQLDATETVARRQLFTCFYSNCDNIVMPVSTATLAGAANRLIPGVSHLSLIMDRTVIQESLALL